MELVNYQEVIDAAVQVLKLGIPYGLIFGITEWCCYTFFGMVFGRKIRGVE